MLLCTYLLFIGMCASNKSCTSTASLYMYNGDINSNSSSANNSKKWRLSVSFCERSSAIQF